MGAEGRMADFQRFAAHDCASGLWLAVELVRVPVVWRAGSRQVRVGVGGGVQVGG
jgi:hypothetical protein